MCCDGPVNGTDAHADVTPAQLRTIAERLAAEAADFIARRRAEVFAPGAGDGAGQGDPIRTKSTPTDPVTVVDTETERLLRDRLAQLRPDDAILGEEEGGSAIAAPGRPVWVLDPIDGTVNFVYGLPAYAVSVGVQIDGVSVAGAVANAATGELFSAAVGLGAHEHRGQERIPLRCNRVDDLSMALVATGFNYSSERRAAQAAVVAQLLPQVRDIRRIGSCALDLCMVAAGRLDAFYESGVHVWDWAAGAVIAAEAGARSQLPPVDSDELVVVAAPGVFDALADRLAQAGGR